MHPKIEALMEEAENRYLKPEEMEAFKQYAISIVQSLKVYESLRDKEVEIFQPVADRLVQAFPQTQQEILERVLKHWLLVLRYCAMAMLLNDREYLQRRLLDWLQGLVKTHQTAEIEAALYQLLQARLKELLSPQALALLQPFLELARATLLEANS